MAPTNTLPTPPARVLQFDAYLVLPDAATRQLRRSPRTGLLSVNTTDRVVVFAYKRKKGGGGTFQRTLQAPHKCVVAALALQLWSREARTSICCCFVSERERECCLEVLQIMGVRVVDVSPKRFVRTGATHAQQRIEQGAGHYTADFDALAAALAHPTQAQDLSQRIVAYSASDQHAGDVAAISRAFFGGSLFHA